jgi:hypothetical protein
MDSFDFQSLLAREIGGPEGTADKRAGVEVKISSVVQKMGNHCGKAVHENAIHSRLGYSE